MRTSLLVALGWFAWALPAPGQTGNIEGTVVDSASRAPLPGVRVAALDQTNAVASTSVTDRRGRFRLTGLALARFTLVFTRVGHTVLRIEGVAPAESGTPLEIVLGPREVVLDPVQVTASRVAETALDAPASISVVSRREIEQIPALTPVEYVRTVTGMDFASKGLVQHTFAVRGLRPVSQGGMLMLADDRRTALPGIGFNVSYLLPLMSDDLERIEVVRGPGAALYGPGANRGVLHFVSRSPFDSRGAALSLAVGERDLLQATGRFAAVVSSRIAFKISGDWVQGSDWEHHDSVEVQRRRTALQGGAAPDTLLIGLRDFGLRRVTAEARADWRPDSATTVVASVGGAEAIRVIDVNGEVGGVQERNWRYSFAQVKLARGRLFANVTYNLNDAGDTYQLRTGLPFIDNSRQTTAQLQHRADAGRVALLYGLDGRWTDPRTGGTIHGRNEDDDLVAEAGGYVHARAVASPKLDLVAALRVDRNNRLNDLVLSPRAAAVFKPAPGHALRLTYNRAFTAPDASGLFLDIVVVPGSPYAVRQIAIPQDGFTFRRDCGGICMRSPFNPAGPETYLAADATLLWTAVVDSMQKLGFDLSGIPQPDGSLVATRLAALDPQSLRAPRFNPVVAGDIADLAPRKRTIFQTLELGYKGVLAGRLLVAAEAYVNRVQDPIGPLFTATPSVFYDSTTLAAYLSGFRTPQEAAQVARAIATIQVGTISPREARDPVDILFVRRQGGAYTVWGADASLTATVSSRVEVTGTYSWVSRNIILDVPTAGTIGLSVPRNKGAVAVRYRDERRGFTAALEGRAVGAFETRSGLIREQTDGYGVVDAHVAYRLSPTTGITLSVDAYNLLDHRHREIGGAPAIGRLVVSRVQVHF
jgi:iron complex outermembrane receptor protein